jgi:hypothetical protein
MEDNIKMDLKKCSIDNRLTNDSDCMDIMKGSDCTDIMKG